ncbi:hypothetical protein [Spirosoma sp.]|uniref:hypothetical protein n=1 Tax=Spirosoma sp. TaxID=1899569 RepID=UPI0026286DDD|nr:hypothetical protein [Spirosoma sp.]MCX6216515.1 hypothetical protein [Spirosoma sp.]
MGKTPLPGSLIGRLKTPILEQERYQHESLIKSLPIGTAEFRIALLKLRQFDEQIKQAKLDDELVIQQVREELVAYSRNR